MKMAQIAGRGAEVVVARGLLIGGQWRARDGLVDCLNPASGEVIGQVYEATADDVRLAVEAAREAQPRWSAAGGVARADVLRGVAALLGERADELAVLLSREEGKTLAEARGEVSR